MPNALGPRLEQRIIAFSLAHPGFGPARISAELRREKWGGLRISPNGVWRCLRRHGLNTRTRRLSLVAGYAAGYERRPEMPEPEREPERVPERAVAPEPERERERVPERELQRAFAPEPERELQPTQIVHELPTVRRELFVTAARAAIAVAAITVVVLVLTLIAQWR